ncbi:MAG TPA: DUF1489 domain-containing protein [Caulobacteraceae bacterium]|jgi:hypothetical protein|nr:DUF1489 domain-containing protein [Caulobacteraceae bacterium]
MPLHLIKLCVGAATPEDLRAWRAQRAAAGHRPIVHTRQTPKRAPEIVAGGSLFWVFKGVILIRQRVQAIETLGEGVERRCEILLDPEMIPTASQPRRAFQGWRYLEPDNAPLDFGAAAEGQFPPDLARRLREAGAW